MSKVFDKNTISHLKGIKDILNKLKSSITKADANPTVGAKLGSLVKIWKTLIYLEKKQI